MKTAGSRVIIYRHALKMLTQAQITALEQTAEALHTEVVQAQVVPRMDGTLQNNAFFVNRRDSARGSVSLVHDTPYARRLYYHPEYRFHREPWTDSAGVRHDGNPNARGGWFSDWLQGGKYENFCRMAYSMLYKRLTGV